MIEDSIFTKIIKGDIPAYKVFEDEKTFAFLDIHPIQPGHTLVVPKNQVDQLWDLSDVEYQAVMNTVRLVAKKLKKATGATRIGIKVIGIDVPHAHIHVIPFNTVEQFESRQDLGANIDYDKLETTLKKILSEGDMKQ